MTVHKGIQLGVRTVAVLVLAGLLSYPADWAIWRVRVALGGGMGSVNVTHVTVAELKAGKEEYYFDGKGPADCTRSLYPQSGDDACWWLARHPQVIERY